MKYERLWERLLEYLDSWADVEVTPGRIDLTLSPEAGGRRTVRIVMTSDDWEQFVTIPYGDFGDAARRLRREVEQLGEGTPYLVYDTYDLVPSAGPDLPTDPAVEQMTELLRQNPEGFGRWHPHRPDAPE